MYVILKKSFLDFQLKKSVIESTELQRQNYPIQMIHFKSNSELPFFWEKAIWNIKV